MNSSKLKILVVGDGRSNIHEVPLSDAFEKIGIDTYRFFWGRFYESNFYLIKRLLKALDKYQFSPYLFIINFLLLTRIITVQPCLIFIYRPTHILKFSLFLSKFFIKDIRIFIYNNDDPFSKNYKKNIWKNFFRIIEFADLIFCYRNKNINDFKEINITNTEILKPWFIPERHFPMADFRKNKKLDVVFIGHFEDDNRLEVLEEIKKTGINLGIYGPPYEWNHILENSMFLKDLSPVRLIWEEEYSQVINSSKIALCFLSKLNNDEYTRRNLEIPACGTAQLSEYSEELGNMFKEGEEILFFKDASDAINKINYLLGDQKKLDDLSIKGNLRVLKDEQDIISRAKFIVSKL